MYGNFVNYHDFYITKKQVRQAIKELENEDDAAWNTYTELGLPEGLQLVVIHTYTSGLDFINDALRNNEHDPAKFTNIQKFKFMVIADNMIT